MFYIKPSDQNKAHQWEVEDFFFSKIFLTWHSKSEDGDIKIHKTHHANSCQ